MKKKRRKTFDELRPEHRRSDLGSLVRGKYADRVAAETNIVVLDPKVAEHFRTRRPSTKHCEGF
jgi:hypothetical protein